MTAYDMRISDWSSDVCFSDLAYGIPILPAEVAADPAAAGAAAARIGGPVALKILSRDITHKSDFGGVMLDLEGAEVVEQAAETRSEEHTSELQSLMRISYAVFCLKKQT